MKKVFFLLLSLGFMLLLASCQPTEVISEYVVSFNTNSENTISDQTVLKDGIATEPSEIFKDSYEFQYWYVSDDSVQYDFSTPVTSNLALNAYWLEVFEVTYTKNNGSEDVTIDVVHHNNATRTIDPTKDGYIFAYWYETDEDTAFDFLTPITDDLVLQAKWEITEAGINALINEDIAYTTEHLYLSDYQLNYERSGHFNKSFISWIVNSKYILSNGTIVRVPAGTENSVAMLTASFTLDGVTIQKTFEIDLTLEDVVITDRRTVPFENLTTEYEVQDGSLELLFEEDGSVPYVKLDEFFTLIEGFVDPEVVITVTVTSDEYVMEYQYYDEDEDYTYELILTINTTENTVSVNDPGFYWAYVYSTATNYGRHIAYVDDIAGESYVEGGNLVFDLDDYGMDALFYEDSLVMPFYLTNQLFAGSSYYNVYYNYDYLYGIYSLPSKGSDEYDLIKTSSMNSKLLPVDLVVHNFNMLAFNLDNFYGLKDIMEVESYYDLLYANKQKLLSTSAKTFDLALFDLINFDFDEPHTSYGSKSYFNLFSWSGPSLTSITQLGPRVTSFYEDGIWAIQDEIYDKFLTEPEDRPLYWFVDNDMKTAFLSLDDFNTSDIEEDSVYNASFIAGSFDDTTDTLLPEINFGDKFFYYNSSTQDYNFSEVLIKHVDVTDFSNYETALVTFGYVYDTENDFYEMMINDVSYTLSLVFDEEYSAIYLGLIQAELPSEDIGDVFVTDLIDIIYADSAVYMEFMLEEIIEASPLAESIIFDLTYNTGGNIGALYRVVGFVTDQPFKITSMNVGTGSSSTSYVQIEGIDSYAYLNWALLTSPVTFSAGNELATIFKENEFGPIIGLQSGGGAASITPVLLPNGTAFTMSSNNLNGYRTGAGTEEDPYVYNPNEFGIVPDFAVSIGLIYDNDTLLNAINQYYYPTN